MSIFRKALITIFFILLTSVTVVRAEQFPSLQVTPKEANDSNEITSSKYIVDLLRLYVNSSIMTINNTNEIRHLPIATFVTPPTVITRGYASAGDGGGAIYDWQPTNIATDDNVFIFQVTGIPTGRYVMRHNGEVSPRQIGAKCDATVNGTGADDTKALNYAAAVFKSYGGGTIKLANYWCRVISGDLVISRRVALVGVSNPKTYTGADSDVFYSGIVLSPSRSVRADASSKIANLVIMRDGLGQKPIDMPALVSAVKQWQEESSVGLMIVGHQAVVQNALIVGFNRCLWANNASAFVIRNVDFDCANGMAFTGVHDTPVVADTHSNNFWGFNLTNHLAAWLVDSVVNGGSGYRTGDVVAVSGGECTIQPKLSVAVTAGVISSAKVTGYGDCRVFPSNPVSVSGGVGTGATFNLLSSDAGFRPGTGYKFEGGEGGNTFATTAIGYRIGINITNWYGLTMIALGVEGGHKTYTHGTIGLQTQNCAANINIIAPYIDTFNYGLFMAHRSEANGGLCSRASNKTAFVTIIGGHIGSALGTNGNELAHFSQYSEGSITSVQFGGGTFPQAIFNAYSKWSVINPIGTNGLDANKMFLVDNNANVEFATEIYGTPSSSSDTCSKGQRRFDTNYRYLCTAANRWVRTPVGSTW